MTSFLADTDNRLRLFAIVSLSFALSFTVFFFTPMDLYVHNPTDFVVDWRFLVPVLLVFSLIVMVIVCAVLIFLWRRKALPGLIVLGICALALSYMRFVQNNISVVYPWLMLGLVCAGLLLILLTRVRNEKPLDVALLLMGGVLVACYTQMLFLNSSMTLITGDLAGYSARTFPNVANLVAWIGITLLPLIVWTALRSMRKDIRTDKALIFGALLIAGMQIVGLVSIAVSYEIPPGYNTDAYSFSFTPLTQLHSDTNIVVFIVDRLDIRYMDGVLEEYPELYDMLDGFTYYRKNKSWYNYTIHNIVNLLTQAPYPDDGVDRGDALDDPAFLTAYWEDAWSRHTLLDSLHEQGFTNNLIADKLSTFGSISQIEARVDNIVDVAEIIKPDYRGIISTMGRLSLGRLAPYLFKNAVLAPVYPAFGETFYTIDLSDPSISNVLVGRTNDIAFFEYVRQADFDTLSGRPTFVFVHLNGTHVDGDINVRTLGYTFDPASGDIVMEGNWLESGRASFEIMYTYFTGLREVGVYDSSTIILLADHGGGSTNASLLIKPMDVHGSLQIDDSTPLSHDYFVGTILELAGVEQSARTPSYFDIIQQTAPR